MSENKRFLAWCGTIAAAFIICAGVAYLAWYRMDTRRFNLIGMDSTSRYFAYTEGQPCNTEGCFYVFRDKVSKMCFYGKVGEEMHLVNFQPKAIHEDALDFRKDQCVGKALSFDQPDDFFKKPLVVEHGNLIARVGTCYWHDTLRFPTR